MKKFITTISLQGKDLTPQEYTAADNEELKCQRQVSFPILVTINNFVEKGEKIIIRPIIVGSNSASENFITFQNELKSISNEKGFSYEMIPIEKPMDDNIDVDLKLFSNLIDSVDDNDDLFADITFGTKPVSALTIMALNYAYKVKKDVNVNKIVYGSGPWDGSKIFDVTPLFYIDSAINNLANLKLQKPEEALRALLGLE